MNDVSAPIIPQKEETMRKQIWRVIHHGRGLSGHAFNVLLMILIMFSIAILPLEFLPALAKFHGTLIVIEVVMTSLFTVEYIARIYAAPSRLRYIFSFFGIVDLLSIAPFYLGFIGTQYIRLIRLVRLFKIGQMEAAGAEEEAERMEHVVGLAPDERVEYVISHHPLFLFFGSIPSVLSITASVVVLFLFGDYPAGIAIAVTLILFALIFFWTGWLNFSYDLIYITSRRLIFQNQHLLGRSINQVNFHAITNVKPHYPNPWSYLLGYGSLIIETPSASVGKIEMGMIREHEKAAHLIMAKSAISS